MPMPRHKKKVRIQLRHMAEEGSLNSPIPPQDGWSGWWRGAIKDEHNSDGDDNFSDGSDEDMAEPRKRARLQKTLGRHLAAHQFAANAMQNACERREEQHGGLRPIGALLLCKHLAQPCRQDFLEQMTALENLLTASGHVTFAGSRPDQNSRHVQRPEKKTEFGRKRQEA